jgi:ADP-ribose pyrophosphatase YjhB (NUDIX family)
VRVKRSVAVVIRKGDGRILVIRRPDDDDELPGIWGLPAGSYRSEENLEELVGRIGRDKLGVKLAPVRRLAAGSQARRSYLLEMELWEASAEREPARAQWEWSSIDILEDGKERGSLCCELALKARELL